MLSFSSLLYIYIMYVLLYMYCYILLYALTGGVDCYHLVAYYIYTSCMYCYICTVIYCYMHGQAVLIAIIYGIGFGVIASMMGFHYAIGMRP